MLAAKLISSVMRRGIRVTFLRVSAAIFVSANVARIVKGVFDLMFDKYHGTRTSGIVPLGALAIESRRKTYGTFYVATPKYEFRRVISHLNIDASRYAFIDFGCGMGRVLFYAIGYGFSRVAGVEFSKYLAEIALDNLSKYSLPRPGMAEICLGDAAEFAIPNEPCVLWFFNPFADRVTAEVLLNVYTAYRSGNREIYLIWYNVTPNAAPLFNAPWLEVVAGQSALYATGIETPGLLQMMEISLPFSIFKTRTGPLLE